MSVRGGSCAVISVTTCFVVGFKVNYDSLRSTVTGWVLLITDTCVTLHLSHPLAMLALVGTSTSPLTRVCRSTERLPVVVERLNPFLHHLVIHWLLIQDELVVPARTSVWLGLCLLLLSGAQLPSQVVDDLVVPWLHREHLGDDRRNLRGSLVHRSGRDALIDVLQLVDDLIELMGNLSNFCLLVANNRVWIAGVWLFGSITRAWDIHRGLSGVVWLCLSVFYSFKLIWRVFRRKIVYFPSFCHFQHLLSVKAWNLRVLLILIL